MPTMSEVKAESTASETTPGGRFGPGNRPRGGSAKGRKLRQPSRLLKDMRWVYEHAEEDDKTPGQKMCRKLMNDNPKEFLTQLTGLEKAHRTGASKESSAPKLVPVKTESPAEQEPTDEGSERAIRLCEKLLDQFHQKQAQEDAALAARPDAAQIASTLQNRLAGALEREAMWKRQVDALRVRVDELESKGAAKASAS
jgi:hypothetical protein